MLQSMGSQSQTQLNWIELTEHDTNRIKERIIWLFLNRYRQQHLTKFKTSRTKQRRKWQPTPVSLPRESCGQGAWWAAVYGVAQSWTWLKRLSSSSSSKDVTMREWSQTQKRTHHSIFIKFKYRQNWWHYKSSGQSLLIIGRSEWLGEGIAGFDVPVLFWLMNWLLVDLQGCIEFARTLSYDLWNVFALYFNKHF